MFKHKLVFLRIGVLSSLFLFVAFSYGNQEESLSLKAVQVDETNHQTENFSFEDKQANEINDQTKSPKDKQANEINDQTTESFFEAIRQGYQLKTISSLLKKLKDIEVRNKYGWTALHLAVDMDNLEVAKYLLKEGANANSETSFFETPLNLAKSKNMAELLFKYNAKIDNYEVWKELHKARYPSLHPSLYSSYFKQRFSRAYRWTPLHSAAWFDRLDVAKFLLEKGSYVNAKSIYGWTPLLMAKSKEMAELLIEYSANIYDRNNREETALHIVSSYKQDLAIAMADFYLEKGLHINATDANDKTPLDHAETKEMEDFLLKRGASLSTQKKIKRAFQSCASIFQSPQF